MPRINIERFPITTLVFISWRRFTILIRIWRWNLCLSRITFMAR